MRWLLPRAILVWMSAPHLILATLFWITMLGVALAAWGPRPERVSG